MSEERLTRIEIRMDEIKDDVAELKANDTVKTQMLNDLKGKFDEHSQLVREHVTSDTRIVKETQPLFDLIPHLAEVVEDHKFKKQLKTRRNEKIKYWASRIGLAIGTLTLLGSASKFFGLF